MANYSQKIFIIAAARSGSKLLRDLIAEHPSVDAIPYDINYIWKCGNFEKSDELEPDSVSDSLARRIRKLVERQLSSTDGTVMLEKSVSNTLRIGYVKYLFPDAKFVHLYRDGRAVTLSALNCWNSSAVSSKNQSRARLLLKLSRFPYLHSFPYFFRAIREQLEYKLGLRQTLPVWGPVYAGIRKDQHTKSDIEVCALQWSRCVEKTLEGLDGLSEGGDYINVRYEDLVADPEVTLRRVLAFASLDASDQKLYKIAQVVSTDFREKWKEPQSRAQLEPVMEILLPGLRQLHYDV